MARPIHFDSYVGHNISFSYPSKNATLAWVGSMTLWAIILLGPIYLAGLIFGNFSHGIWAKNEPKENVPNFQNTSGLKADDADEKT